MSEPGGQETPRKLDVFKAARDLSKLEHAALIGSSVGNYNWAKFKEEANEKKISPDALTPVGRQLPLEPHKAQDLTRIREDQHTLAGLFPFLAEDIDELPSTYQVYLQPVGLIDAETGKIDPIWKLSIVDTDFNFVESESLGNLIRLSETHTPYFYLEENVPGSKFLHLNDELQ